MAGRVVLHVGLPKTGTTYLQGLLGRHREALAERGVLYPLDRPEVMYHAAVEVRGDEAVHGFEPGSLAGTWAGLCERARRHDGLTLISHEVLAGASREQVEAALGELAGLDVRVVVTARDLGRAATAFWQERVKLGRPWTFAQVERDQVRPGLAHPAAREPGEGSAFWHSTDVARAAGRWAAAVGAGNVHVVVAPAPGAPRDELWRRFAEAAGLGPAAAAVDPDLPDRANESLGTAQVALLRQVNEALGDRLPPRQRARLVKRWFAEQVLPAVGPVQRPLTPAGLAEPFAEVTRAWVEEIRREGYVVHGDLADLDPVCGGPGDPHPDDVPAEVLADLVPAAVAELLLETDRRARRGGPTPGAAAPAGLRRVARRLPPRVRRRAASLARRLAARPPVRPLALRLRSLVRRG